MSLLTPNTKFITGFYEKGRYLFAWRLLLFFTLSFSFLSVIGFANSFKEGIVFVIGLVIIIVGLLYLKIKSNFKPVYYLLAISASILSFYTLNNFNELVHFGDFLWLILVILITFFGLGKKEGLIVSFFVMINIIYYLFFSLEENINSIVNFSLQARLTLVIEISTALIGIVYLIYQFVDFHKYAYNELLNVNLELQIQNEYILTQNKEKTTLVQEVHHRVKNNLQIVISLLRLQKKEIKSLEAQKNFTEAINRIMVMSLIHEKLYKDKTISTVKIADYLKELTNDILKLSAPKTPIIITVESEIDFIGLKTIVPLGLIVNELVSNSIQHAFNKKLKGKIIIKILNKSNDQFILSYFDDGEWKQVEKNYSSFGLELIEILAAQLDGDYLKESSQQGTQYIFNLHDVDL